MHALTYFRKDNSATALRKKRHRIMSKIEVGIIINDKGKLTMTWTRISAEGVVRCPMCWIQDVRTMNQRVVFLTFQPEELRKWSYNLLNVA